MRASLFALAALCLVAGVAAQAGIATYSYSDAACTEDANLLDTQTTGVCTQSGIGESKAAYCSNDGSTIYSVKFADTTCTKAYQVSSTSALCGYSQSNMWMKCVNATAGPEAPVTPNTAGWASATMCANSTKHYDAADVCSQNTNPAVKCSYQGFDTTACRTTGNLPNGILSTTQGCSTGGDLRGAAFFSDDKCQTPVMWSMSENSCQDGLNVDSCGAASVPALPSKAVASYTSLTCEEDYYSPPSATFYADGCVNSKKFSCAMVNGTMAGTLETYSDATNKGLCTTLQSTVTQEEGVCVNGKIFVCSYVAPNSAAAAASSFVAMIVAAFVALVAARSL